MYKSLQTINHHLDTVSLDQDLDPYHDFQLSAVMMLLTHEAEAKIILTKRLDSLSSHPGQICFPGGCVEKADKNLLVTALRETEEEVGVSVDEIDVIGQLPHRMTLSGFLIQPYVGLISPDVQFKVNASEVERLIAAPLAFFMNPDVYVEERIKVKGQYKTIIKIHYANEMIWGATAALLERLALCRRQG